jgi:hypothetical protein
MAYSILKSELVKLQRFSQQALAARNSFNGEKKRKPRKPTGCSIYPMTSKHREASWIAPALWLF